MANAFLDVEDSLEELEITEESHLRYRVLKQ
jgi:hypothetical protein